jgi:hypothetical protein
LADVAALENSALKLKIWFHGNESNDPVWASPIEHYPDSLDFLTASKLLFVSFGSQKTL